MAPSSLLRKIFSLRHSQILWGFIAVSILTLAFGQTFYTQPQLRLDKVPLQTIYAPQDASLEDTEQTALLREQARKIKPVLNLDPSLTDTNRQQVKRILNEGQRLRQMMGKFPFIDPNLLSPSLQQSLLQATATEWQAIVSALSGKAIDPPAAWQTETIAALQNYRRLAGQPKLQDILNQITQAKQIHATALKSLKDPVLSESGYAYQPDLFEIPQADWLTFYKQLPLITDRILAQGLAPGLAKTLRSKAFTLQTDTLPKSTQAIAHSILLHSLEPNIVEDPNQTQQLAIEAENSVTSVMRHIQKGDVIAQEGKPITAEQAMWLDYFQLDRRTIDYQRLGIFAGITTAIVALFRLLLRLLKIQLRPRDYALIVLLALTTAILILLRVPSTNLPMLGLLLSTFYNPSLSMLTIGCIIVLLPIGFKIGLQPLLASSISGLLAAAYSSRIRSREDSVILGLAVGLLQGAIYLLLGSLKQKPLMDLINGTAIYGLLGMAWCIVGLGISPYLERFFDVVTTLRLVELANLNRPLLKRLASETPGTFQHTLAVANLAEAAAKELGCNVELVRTGTLYHDIGKMHDPLGFIENQMGGVNKHDVLNNPWESAEIIRKHITEGIAMAKRSGLPKTVQAFIPEHQGAQLIAYFYHKAKQQVAENPDIVLADRDFRYEGPNPQSRETGIVMLADSCEAALRSLQQATPEQAANMIQKIFRARWQDGALEKSGLSRRDLDRIAEVFLQVWQQSNHQRIAYPK
jgi:cyclic-di-AMP phosphodiesterase PgpH